MMMRFSTKIMQSSVTFINQLGFVMVQQPSTAVHKRWDKNCSIMPMSISSYAHTSCSNISSTHSTGNCILDSFAQYLIFLIPIPSDKDSDTSSDHSYHYSSSGNDVAHKKTSCVRVPPIVSCKRRKCQRSTTALLRATTPGIAAEKAFLLSSLQEILRSVADISDPVLREKVPTAFPAKQ